MNFLKQLLTNDVLNTIIGTNALDEALNMKSVTVGKIDKTVFPELKDPVFVISNKSEIIDELITLLGVPKDGTAYRIRTGFMAYDDANKLLLFSKNSFDLPLKLAAKSVAASKAFTKTS